MKKLNQQGNTAVIVLVTVILTALIVGGGVYVWQNSGEQKNDKLVAQNDMNQNNNTAINENSNFKNDTNMDPLDYVSDNSIIVDKKILPFNYTVNQLEQMAKDCGKNYPKEHFRSLINKFNKTDRIVYTFYKKNFDESLGFQVTVLSNKPKYMSLDEFKEDFDLCEAGGKTYPSKLNNKWLLLTSSCGSGFDSNNERNCDEIRKEIEPTLKLTEN